MKRKIIDTLLLLIVAAGCVFLTVALSGGNITGITTIYNFTFLGIMVVLYLIALFGGFFRMADITAYFRKAADAIEEPAEGEGTDLDSRIAAISTYRPLRRNLVRFQQDYRKSQSGICDIEDYINEDETDSLIHRRLLDMVPDILTSLGILGTFMGLVWGLRAFQPSNYEAMTASVTSLVDGIKVAFLTSIYGLILSLINSYSMKTGYSEMTDELGHFVDRFHTRLVPSAEMEAQNRLLNNQREQNELIRSLTAEFSDQVAHGFAANMAPTLDRINTQLGSMMTSISQNQQMFLQDIVNAFVKEMKTTFRMEFKEFGDTLQNMNEMVNRNIKQSQETYRQVSADMRSVFTEDEAIMHAAVAEFSEMQKNFGRSVDTMTERYEAMMQEIQKAQEESLKNLAKSEQESARFWVACNQAMKNYLEAAASAYDRFESANTASDKVLKALTATYQKNEKLLDTSQKHMGQFQDVQQQMNESLAEIRRLFYQMEVAGGDGKSMYLYPGISRQSKDQEQRMLRQVETIVTKSEKRQDEKLAEILGGIDDLNDKTDKKSRWFGR